MICPIGATCLAVLSYGIHDGDTITRADAPNLRIWGVDSPELRDPGGNAAGAALAALTAGQPLACRVENSDRYGRLVVQCWLPDGRDIACEMVAAGHAQDWPRYSGGHYAGCAQ